MELNRKPRYQSTTYEHLIFDKGAKTIQWTKESIFNNGAVITGCQPVEE